LVDYLKRIRKTWLSTHALLCWVPPTILGTVLRFWSLGFGLPSHFRPDEDMVVLPSLAMVGGNLDPHDYTYPTLYKYILAAIYRGCMALGLGAEGYDSAWQYAAYGFFVDGSFFFLVARSVSAVFGILTIMALYRLGELAYGRWVGCSAAWLLSASVLHVRDSHFGVTDITSVAFLMFALVSCVQMARRGQWQDYLMAGALVGLAAAAKYGAALGLVPLLVAHLYSKPDGLPLLTRWLWDWKVWCAGLLCVLVFLLLSPYHAINAAGFVRDFGFQMRHVFEYGHGEDLGPGWMYHPAVTLRYGLGLLVLLGSVGGLIVMGMRRSGADWVLLALFAAFFMVIGQGRVVFFRYALPLVPLCCVFCAVLLDRLRGLHIIPKPYVSAMGIGLVCLCIAEPLYASVRVNRLFGEADTRVLARAWVEEQIPEGHLIANVGGLYGDVQFRNRHGMSWWLWRYYKAFPTCDENALAKYLKPFESQLPPHFATLFLPGEEGLDKNLKGDLALFSNPEISVVITHEHPLHYSTLDSLFRSTILQKAELWATFSPFGPGASQDALLDLQDALFDLQDAFYYPLGRWGDVERGGPIVNVWYLKDRAFSVFETPRDQTRLLRDSFFWIGNTLAKEQSIDDAKGFYRRALNLDPAFGLAREKLASLEDQQNKRSVLP
jgi:hypothetical protein